EARGLGGGRRRTGGPAPAADGLGVVGAVEPHVHRAPWSDPDRVAGRRRARLGVAHLAAAGEADDGVAVGHVEDRYGDGAAGVADRRARVEVAEDLAGALARLAHPVGTVLGHADAVAPALAVDHQNGD